MLNKLLSVIVTELIRMIHVMTLAHQCEHAFFSFKLRLIYFLLILTALLLHHL